MKNPIIGRFLVVGSLPGAPDTYRRASDIPAESVVSLSDAFPLVWKDKTLVADGSVTLELAPDQDTYVSGFYLVAYDEEDLLFYWHDIHQVIREATGFNTSTLCAMIP